MMMTIPVSRQTAQQAAATLTAFEMSASMTDRRMLEDIPFDNSGRHTYDVVMLRPTTPEGNSRRSADIIAIHGRDGEHVVIAVY